MTINQSEECQARINIDFFFPTNGHSKFCLGTHLEFTRLDPDRKSPKLTKCCTTQTRGKTTTSHLIAASALLSNFSKNLGVSKNRDTPKWMVKMMENPIKMDDLGENTHYFRKHPGLSPLWNSKSVDPRFGKAGIQGGPGGGPGGFVLRCVAASLLGISHVFLVV